MSWSLPASLKIVVFTGDAVKFGRRVCTFRRNMLPPSSKAECIPCTYLSMYLSISMYVSMYVSIHMYLYPSMHYLYLSISIYVSISIYLSGFLTAVAVFRKPNAIPLCFSIDPVPNFLSWLLVLLPSTFFLDVLFSFSPAGSNLQLILVFSPLATF